MTNTSQSRKRKYRSFHVDLSIVPSNVFSLRGDPFYKFIQDIASEDLKDLLAIQKISTARCFLNTNPLDLLRIRSDDPLIIELQNRLSFKLADGGHVVLAGVNGDVHYLAEILSMYSDRMTKQQRTESGSRDATKTNEENGESTANMSDVPSVIQPSTLSIEEHRHYLSEQIRTWWEKARHKHHLEEYQLIDPRDYQMIIDANSAIIMCSCRVQINLVRPRDRPHYQLSNFYKHLNENRKCKVLRQQRISPPTEEEKGAPGDDDPDCLPSSSSSATLAKTSHGSNLTATQNERRRRKIPSANDSSIRSKRKRV